MPRTTASLGEGFRAARCTSDECACCGPLPPRHTPRCMKILWVKGGKLLPVDTGGKIRSYNILRHLARRHQTTLLSYYPGPRDEPYEHALEREFPGALALSIGGQDGMVGEVLQYVVHFPRAAPFSVTKFTADVVRRGIVSLLAERRPDVAVCDFLAPSLNFSRHMTVPTALFQHNVESGLWRRQAKYERNIAMRAIFAIEARKMFRYERSALTQFTHIIAVSEHDRTLMRAMAPDAQITVVPTGVDVGMYRRTSPAVVTQPTVMFLGSMDWPANSDGVTYFCEQIWPRVVAAVPGATFRVVGRRPPARVQNLASDSVEIVGGVEDVTPYLHAATVFVVPLRIGGGTRLKIYEAMASGLPIVSTSVGAEGLDVTHQRDILLADDPIQFAADVIDLLTNHVRRQAMARAAETTATRFDWSVIADEFQAVLERIAFPTQPHVQ